MASMLDAVPRILAHSAWLLALPLALLAAWQCLSVALSLVAIRRSLPVQSSRPAPSRRVALLYVTCDDFNADACGSLLSQDGVEAELFLLDDSSNPEKMAQVDAWAAEHPTARVIRRCGREGYKAGNINHWLRERGGAAEYEFALLADADEQLPPDFTSRLLRAIEAHGSAFAQGCHEARPPATAFQALLGLHVAASWRFITPARQITGLPWMLGHGVLLRLADIEAAGGFPQIVSEDLALTITLAERGRLGVVAPDAIGQEDFPAMLDAYWRRLRRWIAADTELVRLLLPRLWRSPLGLAPKLDLTLRELRLPLLACGWLLPIVLAAAALAGAASVALLPSLCWLALPLLLIPHLTVWMLPGSRPMRCLVHSAVMPMMGLAGLGLYMPAVIEGLRGRNTFRPTGSSNARARQDSALLWNAAAGALIIAGGCLSANLALAAVGFAIFAAPWLRRAGSARLLTASAAIFWLLVCAQIALDAASGSFPVEHLLPLAALGAATD